MTRKEYLDLAWQKLSTIGAGATAVDVEELYTAVRLICHYLQELEDERERPPRVVVGAPPAPRYRAGRWNIRDGDNL